MTYGEMIQAPGRVGRDKHGNSVVLTASSRFLPTARNIRQLRDNFRNECATDLLLTYPTRELLTLPECFQPSEAQVASALVEIQDMGLLRRDGTVSPSTRLHHMAMPIQHSTDAPALELIVSVMKGSTQAGGSV